MVVYKRSFLYTGYMREATMTTADRTTATITARIPKEPWGTTVA